MSIGDGIIWQERPDELLDILTATFQRRNEMNFAWKSVVSQFLALPNLRGCWPMSSVDENADAYDLSGQGRTLSANGTPVFYYPTTGLFPQVRLNLTGDYLDRADEAGLDIQGNEAHVEATQRGVTLGGWYYRAGVGGGGIEGLMSKWNSATNNRSYILYLTPSVPTFAVSNPGNATSATIASTVTMADDAWYFIVGRYEYDVEVGVCVNGTWATGAAVVGTMFNGNAPLIVGGLNAGAAANLFNGIVSMQFLCAQALSDSIIGQLWEQSRSMFGR